MINLVLILSKVGIFLICALNSSKYLFDNFLTKVVYSKMYFFDKNPVGRIINRFSSDITVTDNSLTFNF